MNENEQLQPVIFVSTTQLNLKTIDEEGNLHFIACQSSENGDILPSENALSMMENVPVAVAQNDQGLPLQQIQQDCVAAFYQPKSLYEIALNYVGEHIEYVQSLEEFPSMVGKELFEIAYRNGAFNFTKYNNTVTNYVLSIFVDAYPEDFLTSLNFANRNGLLVINGYSDSLYLMLKYVRELDLSDLQLGDNHDIFEHFANFNNVKSLSLRNNSLSNIALRQLTLPTRMFARGIVAVEHLDISANPKITEESIIWLFCFKKLQTLDISDCSLNESKILPILQQNNFSKDVNTNNVTNFNITTAGWAEHILDSWVIACEEKLLENAKKMAEKSKVKTFYKNRRNQVDSVPVIKKHVKKGVRTIFTRVIENEDFDYCQQPAAKKLKAVTTGDHCYSNILMLYQGGKKSHTKNDVQSVFDAIGK